MSFLEQNLKYYSNVQALLFKTTKSDYENKEKCFNEANLIKKPQNLPINCFKYTLVTKMMNEL